jgi:hypothetical protein
MSHHFSHSDGSSDHIGRWINYSFLPGDFGPVFQNFLVFSGFFFFFLIFKKCVFTFAREERTIILKQNYMKLNTYGHTNLLVYIYIYIYIYPCVFVCVFFFFWKSSKRSCFVEKPICCKFISF